MRGKRAETVDQLEAVRRAVPVIALGLAIVALILAAMAMNAGREAAGRSSGTWSASGAAWCWHCCWPLWP